MLKSGKRFIGKIRDNFREESSRILLILFEIFADFV